MREATLTTHLPMGDDGSGNTWDLAVPGYTPAKNEGMEVVTDLEGPAFFHTMGIPLVQGRDFTTQDREGAPLVAMVNEDMAHRYFPKGNALGSTVIMGPDKQACQIIGIVKNYAYYSPQNTDPEPVVYLPIAQHYQNHVFVAVRSRTTAEAVAPALRQAVARLDGALPLENVHALKDVSEVRYQFARIPVELLGVFALASLLVATLGLYAVMAYAVTERNREFALRMAVGATRGADRAPGGERRTGDGRGRLADRRRGRVLRHPAVALLVVRRGSVRSHQLYCRRGCAGGDRLAGRGCAGGPRRVHPAHGSVAN